MSKADDLLDKISEIQAGPDKVQSVVSAIANSWVIQHLSLQDQVLSAGGQFVGTLHDIGNKLEPLKELPKFFKAIEQSPNGWEEIFKMLSQLEGELRSDHMSVDGYWEGPAASQYKSATTSQLAAVAAMKEHARNVRDLIASTREKLDAFITKAIVSGIAVIVEIAVAANSGEALAAAPVVLGLSAAALGGTILYIGTLVDGYTDLRGKVSESMRKLRDAIDDSSQFGGMDWPDIAGPGIAAPSEWKPVPHQ